MGKKRERNGKEMGKKRERNGKETGKKWERNGKDVSFRSIGSTVKKERKHD